MGDKTKTILTKSITVLKDTAIICLLITIIFSAGKLCNKIDTLETKYNETVSKEVFTTEKKHNEEKFEELKKQNNQEHEEIKEQLSGISYRTDKIYELLLNKETEKTLVMSEGGYEDLY